MPKLPTISGKQLIKVLKKIGFKVVSQRGSHVKLARNTQDGKQIIIVPNHPILKPGTLRNGILKQIPMSVPELNDLLSK